MKNFVAKKSVEAYLRDRWLILHPLFISMQVFLAVWVTVKRRVIQNTQTNFVLATQIFLEILTHGAAFFGCLAMASVLVPVKDLLLIGKTRLIPLLAAGGVVCVGVSTVFFCLGRATVFAHHTAPWMLLTPVLVVLFGLLLRYEKWHCSKLLGIILAFSGLSTLLVSSIFTVYLPIFSVTAAAGVLVWRYLIIEQKLQPLVIATWGLGTATGALVVAYILMDSWSTEHQPDWLEDSTASLRLFGVVAMLAVAVCISLFVMLWAISESSLSIVAIYVSARPTAVMVFALFNILDEGLWEVGTSVIALVGVCLGLAVCTHR